MLTSNTYSLDPIDKNLHPWKLQIYINWILSLKLVDLRIATAVIL